MKEELGRVARPSDRPFTACAASSRGLCSTAVLLTGWHTLKLG